MTPVLVLALLGADPPDEPNAIEIFEAREAAFCREGAGALSVDDHALVCPLAHLAVSSCPGLAEACARPPRPDDALDGSASDGARSRRDVRRALREQREAARARQPEPDRPEPERGTLEVPAWVAGAARALFYLALAGLALVVARLVAGALGRSRRAPRPEESGGQAEVAPSEAPEEAARGPVERDVERLLSLAEAAAARGDHGAAIAASYAASLRKLEGEGLVELHPSRTNGDHLRALAGHPVRGEVAALVRDVERTQFGDAPADAARFQSIHARVRALVKASLATLALCLVAACSPGHAAGGASAGDWSPSGQAALLAVLRDAGHVARMRTAPLAEAVEGTLVIAPSASLDGDAWDEVERFARGGGTVVVAATSGPPAFADAGLAEAEDLATFLSVVGPSRARIAATAPVAAPRWRLASPAGPDDVLRRGDEPYAAARPLGRGTVIAIADETLLTNAGLALGSNARFAARWLGAVGSGPIEIVDGMTGVGAASPIESLSRARLGPAMVHLFAAFALLLACRGVRFGAPRDPVPRRRRAFVEHARALGLAYARARASRHALGLFSTWAIERLRERVRRRAGIAALAEHVAARTGRAHDEVLDVLSAANAAREEVGPVSAPTRGSAAPPARDEARDLALFHELDSFLSHGPASHEAPQRAPDPPEDPR